MASLGISEFTTMPWSFEQDLACYSQCGAQAIEVVEAKLDQLRFAEQLGALMSAGLQVSGVQPKVRTFFASRMTAEPKSVEDRTACLRDSIERLGRHTPGAPFITNTGAHPCGDMSEAMRVTARQLRHLAPIAADNGVRLALEPLNPTSMNAESAIWTVDQALSVIEDAGHDAVGICLDYWNIWQNADIDRAIARAGDRIFTVQASDWRDPRSFADRIVPGDGIIPLSRLIAATHAAGFRGAYVTEIFSLEVADSLYEVDLASVVSRSLKAMRHACHAAGIDADDRPDLG
jgi:sugar phosphate isomerase/epimerase